MFFGSRAFLSVSGGTFASAAVATVLTLQACGSPGFVGVPDDAAAATDEGATDASPADGLAAADGGGQGDASDSGGQDADATASDGGFDAGETSLDGSAADSGFEATDGEPADVLSGDAPAETGDALPNVCGDGIRNPATEECDNGASNVDVTGACSTKCLVQDYLAASSPSSFDAGPLEPYQYPPHRMGHGRHALAAGPGGFGVTFLEEEPNGDYTLRAETFTPGGVRVASFPVVGTPSPDMAEADPVLAGTSATQYAAVWEDTGGGQSSSGIAMAILDTTPDGGVGAVVHANAPTEGPESEPDAIWVGGELVVAWEDGSGASVDLKLATFDGALNALSGETALASTSADEVDVALAPFNGGWVAAWKASENGVDTLHVRSGGVEVVTNSFSPGIDAERPALVQVGPTTVFVAVSVAEATDDAGDTTTVLQGAVVDLSGSGPATVTANEIGLYAEADGGDGRFPEGYPGAATAGGEMWLAAWTGGQPGDPLEDELWLASVGVGDAGVGEMGGVGRQVVPLPRWQANRGGEQEFPVVAAVNGWAGNEEGAVVAVWEDDGWTVANAAGEDVVMEVVAVPMVRFVVTGGSQ